MYVIKLEHYSTVVLAVALVQLAALVGVVWVGIGMPWGMSI